MVTKKDLIIAIVGTFCLTSTLFTMIIPIRSQTSNGTYDPWMDLNDDGVIDSTDLGMLGSAWGASGDPTKNVNITNWPQWLTMSTSFQAATKSLTARLDQKGVDITIGPVILSASNEIVGIGGKNVTFRGGDVSGGVTWYMMSKPNDDDHDDYCTSGGATGSGRVEVYDSGNNLLAQITIPLNSMLTVQNVDRIKVYAETPLPWLYTQLSSYGYRASYSALVMSSVYWVEQ